MTFERKLKNKTIFFVMVILFCLSSVYYYVSINNQRKFKDWQIQRDSEIVSIEIKNLLYTQSKLYKEKIRYFVSDRQIKELFSQKESDKLYKKVFPFYSVLRSENPYYFIINFYQTDNRSFLDMEKGPSNHGTTYSESNMVSSVNKSHARKTGFEFSQGSLFYKIVEPIFLNGEYCGCVEFGIREDEIVEKIAQDYGVSIASYFTRAKLGENILSEFNADHINGKHFIHTSVKNEIFTLFQDELTAEIEPGVYDESSDVYFISKIPIDNAFLEEGFAGVIFSVNITELYTHYKAYAYKTLTVIGLILIIVYLLLYFSFNILLEKFFHLQESLDQKLAEKSKEILDSNVELNQIFNTTANSMRLIDKDFNILRVNRSFSSISGISKDNAEGKKCYDVFPGPYCHTADCPLVRIKNGEQRVEMDLKKRNKSGEIVPGIMTSVAFTGQNGELLGIIEDFKDISQRVAAEEALINAERQFSVFMDNLPVAVFMKDEDSRMTYLNKYMNKLLPIEESQDKTPTELFAPDYAERVIREDQEVLNGKVLVVEEELADQLGEKRFYMTHKFRFKDQDNKWKIGGISLDISKRRKMEFQLRILSNAIQNSPACVIITDLNGSIEFVNPSFTKITGYTPEDVIGRNISLLRGEELSDSIFKDIIDTVKSGHNWFGEFHNKKKNGEAYWELASMSPVRNNDGEATHFVLISEDITDRKHSEKELIKAKEKAEEADSLKSAFLANLSHEIRTPMNAIIGFSNLLLDEEMPFSERVKINTLINDNSKSLLGLIDNVIEISKLQSGQIDVHKSECKLNELIDDIFEDFEDKIDNDPNKEIQLSINKKVKDKEFTIISDENKLRQVITNLVENAIKFTDRGFVEFGYSFRDDSMLQFYVIDSGIGISDEKSELIYEVFRQADDSSTRQYGGTGIGLAISKRIVQYLGGEIWAQSTPEQGTNIYFTLPYEPNEPKFESVTEEDNNSYDWDNKTVLVVEDIDTNYIFLQELLSQTKVNLLWARDGYEAVDMCLDNDVDLVLMDIRMPGLDGFEASKEIRKHKSKLKIIGQTAYVHDDEEQKCKDAGFDNFISKPIDAGRLLDTIDQVFSVN